MKVFRYVAFVLVPTKNVFNLRFVKIPVECPTFKFECSDFESLVMKQTRLPLFRAVGELCNPYFGTVSVVVFIY